LTPDTVIAWAQSLVHDPLLLACVLALSTLLTEDGALIAGSLLVGSGMVAAPLAISALAVGITAGDVGLYGLGALARQSRFLRSRLPLRKAAHLKRWLVGKQTLVLFFSRFVPGTRLPTYLAFGFLRLPLVHFTLVMAAAASVWVTGMVLFVSETQKAFSGFGSAPALGAGLLVACLVIMLARRLARGSRYADADRQGNNNDAAADTEAGIPNAR
jgi:membrane protein DedA with SNARE-associated domain